MSTPSHIWLEDEMPNASVTKIIYRDGSYQVIDVANMSYMENGKAQGD